MREYCKRNIPIKVCNSKRQIHAALKSYTESISSSVLYISQLCKTPEMASYTSDILLYTLDRIILHCIVLYRIDYREYNIIDNKLFYSLKKFFIL